MNKFSGIMLKLTDINIVPKQMFPYVEKTIEQINIVMKALVPNIWIEVYNAFDKLTEKGQDDI